MDPLHQFQITPIVPITVAGADVSFTNSSLWMAIAVAAAYLLVMAGTRQHAMVPGRLQSVVELTYEFVAGILRDAAGKEGMRFFPIVFTIFMFILMGNMLGMIPGSFTFTSHIIVTFFMAICVWIGVTVIGFWYHGPRFLGFFVPHGAPKFILPLMVPIEVISYCVRPISLSVRLFCNMMAGHTMLKVFAAFVVSLSAYFVIPGILPAAITVVLLGFEFVVAFLQAYIFTVLTCLYLNDAIHMH
ncbi:F0F1 ATP synthase subunit A [Benzoatithermus flavus]|uniref:ATP synthase subunit a n=1 Tax=Benzoatithermus flavus TaxID=3108223 RepID=A0ABU8XP70_9PROT